MCLLEETGNYRNCSRSHASFFRISLSFFCLLYFLISRFNRLAPYFFSSRSRACVTSGSSCCSVCVMRNGLVIIFDRMHYFGSLAPTPNRLFFSLVGIGSNRPLPSAPSPIPSSHPISVITRNMVEFGFINGFIYTCSPRLHFNW